MKNYIQPGEVVTLTTPAGGLKSGQGVLVGAIFGVAAFDAAEAADIEVATTGVFELPKDGSNIAQGAALYWDVSAAALTTTASGNLLVGAATAAAGGSATTVNCRLNGVSVV